MWIIFALCSAATRAVSQVLRKQAVTQTSPTFMTLLLRVVALPVVFIFGALFSEFALPSDMSFWVLIITAGIIETFATIASFASLKANNLSKVTPIQSFIPVFLLLLSLVLLWELPPLVGVFGVIVITIGVYILKLERGQTLIEPFQRVLTDHGSRLMLVYAGLSAVVIFLEKQSLTYTNPATSLAVIYIVQIVCLVIYLFFHPHDKHIRKVHHMRTLLTYMSAIAVVTAISHLFQFYSVDAIYASYAFAVQRLDIILILIFSAVILKEPVTKRIYIAGALSVFGVILLNI